MYRAIAVDLYDKGVVLVRGKYRYLRFSYLAFIAAFFAAAATYAVASIID